VPIGDGFCGFEQVVFEEVELRTSGWLFSGDLVRNCVEGLDALRTFEVQTVREAGYADVHLLQHALKGL
jgi:hypothetical protein